MSLNPVNVVSGGAFELATWVGLLRHYLQRIFLGEYGASLVVSDAFFLSWFQNFSLTGTQNIKKSWYSQNYRNRLNLDQHRPILTPFIWYPIPILGDSTATCQRLQPTPRLIDQISYSCQKHQCKLRVSLRILKLNQVRTSSHHQKGTLSLI